MTYYCSAFTDRPRIKPADPIPAVGVLADPARLASIIGAAYPGGQVGGFPIGGDPKADYPPPECVWRIVIDRTWDGQQAHTLEQRQPLDGRFVLRLGRFIELSEDAV